MRRFKVLVFSRPFEGRDDEFNAWYSAQHLPDICALPGFVEGQRFSLNSVPMGQAPNRYLAIYDVETDDPEWVIDNMFAQRDTDGMPISPAIDIDATLVMFYEEMTPVVGSLGAGNVT